MKLTRICNHSDAYVDNKSKPDYEKMPDWWISSTWIQPESDDEEDDNESKSPEPPVFSGRLHQPEHDKQKRHADQKPENKCF